ncbi:MAG: PolC-type DNA polymerase III [Lachnospiraceae bacterium]|nr:PolC-type DNA polymerase III [Lachnospiraceae bacterium]
MEEKKFLEVFPYLKLEGRLYDLMSQVTVTRVASVKDRHFLRVYIRSSFLIPKRDIFEVEKILNEMLRAYRDAWQIKIYERFELSSQYDAKTVMELYRDSILEELKAYSHVLYVAFKDAQISYPANDRIHIQLDENCIVHMQEKELRAILDKIFQERCGLNVSFSYSYIEKKKEDTESEEDILTSRRIEQISSGRLAAGAEESAQSGAGNSTGNSVPGRITSKANSVEMKKTGTSAQQSASFGTKQNGDGNGRSFGGQNSFSRNGQDRSAAFGERNSRPQYRRGLKSGDNPDLIYGKDFDGPIVKMEDILGEMGEVIIHGKVIALEQREIRNERVIISFVLTDFTDSITAKLFIRKDQVEELTANLKKGAFLKLKGITVLDSFDKELTIGSVSGIKKASDFTTKREDLSPEKRVELHCHTKMSDMDGVSEVSDIIKRAYAWGHKAIAITDHGVVQSFPTANHVWEDLWKEEKARCKEAGIEPDKEHFFKVIYGCEAYLVDDTNDIAMGPDLSGTLRDRYVVFDIETTGFSPVQNRIIEIGAVKVENGEITDRFSEFVNPKTPIPFEITNLTSITDDMVSGAEDISVILPRFLQFCEGCKLVAHNAQFDTSFIRENCKREGYPFHFTYLDTLTMSRVLLPGQSKHTLDAVAKTLKVVLQHHHRAVDDAECTALIFLKMSAMCEERDVTNLTQVNAMGHASAEAIAKLPSYHIILLAQNDIGRVNLYTMISESHLKYFNRVPKIPRSLMNELREGILIGSACEAGELYRALLDEKSDEDIANIVAFYDYLEIQPLGNNAFMIESDRVRSVHSMEDIRNLNRRIVELGEQFHKPVVATCDVHFLDPEDEVYRRIIMAGKGFADADSQAPLYLRTTEEMLKEFDYLPPEKAREVVITNPNLIADQIEHISPVRPDKCPPVIPDSDKTLTEICYNKAHEMYGQDLPDIVKSRLEKELNSIIKNGFAVMYIIAQKLVWKSNEDGYLVGSRGSVGSSFVATMAGITEVNPLQPHYYCKNCHYSEFDGPEIQQALSEGSSGCDMPDKVCPVCGAPLKKDGFDIPFETFLGFKGDKEPDIDLNFSGEYQSKAHKYTEVIFGAGQTFKAGTVGTVADKTAYGYVRHYFEDKGITKRSCEIERISMGCTGVRRTTGQHPGGIIVLPLGENINSFTPVQHPANDMTTDIITTHFDYHSIDHNLLKLDILGHDDPTMIRMLQDLTGVDPTTVPLDDKQVMSLFQNTSALGITPEDIDGTDLGSLGIPEFGTEFVFQMLRDTKPQRFSDLIRISGLGHGTDVWLGNAQTLILEGKATIGTAICTRDDIMTYLIRMGVESSMAFTIMESVRKGKGLKPEMEEAMLEHDVPDWYIWSCKKIKYMFPKAHAAAYVMMAWRIGYFKINYPLAYYAAYFSIRASGFSYELMCQGKETLRRNMAELKARKDKWTKTDEDTFRDMKSVLEMYARGFEFLPIDIFRVHARNFQIIDGKIMPALCSIAGLGEGVAESITAAASKGEFLSKEDFRERAKVSQTITDKLCELGILKNLPESNQISLFDLL